MPLYLFQHTDDYLEGPRLCWRCVTALPEAEWPRSAKAGDSDADIYWEKATDKFSGPYEPDHEPIDFGVGEVGELRVFHLVMGVLDTFVTELAQCSSVEAAVLYSGGQTCALTRPPEDEYAAEYLVVANSAGVIEKAFWLDKK